MCVRKPDCTKAYRVLVSCALLFSGSEQTAAAVVDHPGGHAGVIYSGDHAAGSCGGVSGAEEIWCCESCRRYRNWNGVEPGNSISFRTSI